VTDYEREEAINALFDLWMDGKATYGSWIELIKERSQEQIEQMEREKHLV
jgi:hypothetical protein